MAEFLVDFKWFRDRKGYRLIEAVPPKPGEPYVHPLYGPQPAQFLSGSPGEPQRVVRKGGELLSYRPLDSKGLDTLFLEFASCARTPAGVLNFIEKYGPLTPNGLKDNRNDKACADYEIPGDEVPLVIKHAAAMKSWLDISPDAADYLTETTLNLFKPQISLIVDPIHKQPRLSVTPSSLLDALWLQFGQKIAGGIIVKTCPQCGWLFGAGPGTTRRKDAKFCTNEHQITFNSEKRSGT